MSKLSYIEMRDKHQKEVNDFPMIFAFSAEQLKEGLLKLGVTLKECYSIGNGGFIRKADSEQFINMMTSHHEELMDALKDKDFARNAFRVEMDNREYAINWDGDDDVLAVFGLTFEKLEEMGLLSVYCEARESHMRMMEENGYI